MAASSSYLLIRLVCVCLIDCDSDDGYTAVQWETAQVNPARDRRFGDMQRHMMLGIQSSWQEKI